MQELTVKLFYKASSNTFPSSVLPDSTVSLQSLLFLLQFYLLRLAHPSVCVCTPCAYTRFAKAHVSMGSHATASCNTKSYTAHTLNQFCSWDSGAIKEPGTALFKRDVLCSQSQTAPTSDSMGTLSFLPFATLCTLLQSAQVLRRQLLLARSFKFQATASPASRSIKFFCF